MARILIIDDDDTSRELITYLLDTAGHTIRGACDGQAGIEMMQAETPDLVICDCQMPRVTGLEVAAFMRNDPALRAIPLVAITAAAMAVDRERALAAGFSKYIVKPFDPLTIVSQLKQELPG